MIKKQEVIDYYANNRKDSNKGMCSPFVLSVISRILEDENGFYSVASEMLCGPRDYYTMDDIKHIIRCELSQYIADLQKIAEI